MCDQIAWAINQQIPTEIGTSLPHYNAIIQQIAAIMMVDLIYQVTIKINPETYVKLYIYIYIKKKKQLTVALNLQMKCKQLRSLVS